jgi:hypothetical protein
MSSDKAHDAPAIPDHVLPLPAKPNIEFERKRAKHILRSIGDGDVDALSRVRRHRSAIAPADVKLSDVQLTIAREYGFSSWPKLVSYYETFERHDKAGPHYQSYRRDHYELHVQWVIEAHARRQPHRTRGLAAFVPRFYGRTDEEIFATPITRADARLVVARNERFSSWDALIEHAGEPRDREMSVEEEWEEWQRRNPAFLNEAYAAIRRHDTDALTPLIDAHPDVIELLENPPRLGNLRGSILVQLILTEQKDPSPQTKGMIEFLVGRGANLPAVLSRMLLMGIHRKPEDVAYLLNRGADPNWLPPDGVPVLEHALLNYWNPEAVDLIARRVTPRKAFWIAAGLGDVPTMLTFLDRNGKPTPQARANRPDLTLVLTGIPCRPDADDLEIVWEAFAVAGFNQRLNAIDALLERGFPIDYSQWGSTLLSWAEGNSITVLAEHLKKRGAKQ